AIYGYMGWTNALLMNVKAARITSAYGRYYIKEVRERAESKGLTVIYIDTDGIQLVGGKREDYEELLEVVNKDLPIRIELEYIAERGIYVAKKKYAHLVEGRLIAKGFEFVRRDYPSIIKEAQKKVVEMALRGSDLDEIRGLINEYRSKILNREVKKEDLIIIETMGKELDKFERRTKGFYVAMWLLERKGIEVHRGQVLRILIVKGPGSVNERARPAEFFDLDDVDLDYYVKLFDQVMERTLSSLKKVGISEKRTGGLEEWFG
ncbi:MAG: DNA polymerase domain-containing protein, partial [Candidatus Korarchaeota archaeon]|nr:DNA polymerase domain-containing protein [Candidatus Korarchaeota archaeon]